MKKLSSWKIPHWTHRPLAALGLLLATAGAAQAQTLAISGTGGSTTNDVAAFVDRVEIVRASDNTVVTGAIANAGFETPAQTVGGHTYRPTNGSWTFTGLTGITYAGTGLFGAPTTPDGVQAAFVQNSGTPKTGNTISQALTLAAGSYRVRFLAAQRGYAPYDQGLVVTMGGVQVGSNTPTSTTSYVSYTSNAFTVTNNGTVAVAPALTSLNPTSASAGTSVTLMGTDLTGATAVRFNGTAATAFAVVNSTTLTATVPTGASSGPVTVTTPGGTSNGVAFTVTTTVASLNRVGNAATNASTVSYTVTFAAAVTGLTASNFALATTGSVAGAGITSVAGSGTTYTVTVSTGTGDGTLGLNLANATGLSPGVSNVPFTGQVYTIDKTAPTVIITSTIAPNGGNTTTSPIVFEANSSEFLQNISAFSFDNVTNYGPSSAIIYRGSSLNAFTYSIRPASIGAVTVTIPVNSVADAAGNTNATAVSYTIYYGTPTAAPVVVAPATNSLTNGLPTYSGTAPAGSTVTLYLASGGGAPVALGTTTAQPTGSFSFASTTALSSGSYSVYATAQASGALVSANSNTNTFTVDATPPTATLSTTAGSATSTAPLPFSVSFSESVTGLSASSFTVTNGTVTSGPTGSGSGPYTFSVTPTSNGPVSVRVAANAVRDAVGNGNTASNTLSVQYTAPVAASVSVQYQTGDLGQPTDGQVRPFLQLVNSGTTAVPYSSLTVRYWLTAENFMGQLVTPIDYAKLGTGFVSARYVALATPRQGAFGYIEYSFAAGAGSLAAGTDSGPIYGKAYKPDYSNFDETDDWSYQTSGSFTTNEHVTLYQNGTLISGTEPPAVAERTALQVLAGSRDASTSTQYVGVQLQVRNTGNVPVNYSDLKVRYYLTRDGASTLVANIDYAKLGASNISLRTVNLAAPVSGADAYVEFTFSSALGVFYPRTSTEDILAKIRRDDYGLLDQTNDYPFSGSTTLAVNNRIPAYLNNQLVFGTPPAGAPARPAATTSQPASAATAPSAAVAAAPSAAVAAAPSAPLELSLTGSPNPFSDLFRVQFALPTAQAYTLAVYDGQGRLVQQLASGQTEASQAQQVEVPTQTYAAGLYLVRLTTAAGVQHLKLIKQ